MRDEIIYRLLCVMMLLLGLLPGKLTRFMADILGLIWFKFDVRHRKITLENLKLSLGNELSAWEQWTTAKKIFKNIAYMFFELGWAYHLKREDLPRNFSIKGLEHLQRAHNKGRGVLALLGHIGNWELLGAGIALTGYPCSTLYRKFDFAPLERLMLNMREKYGTQMIPLRGASRKIDALLASGEVVGTLLDQNVDWYKGVFVDFFGRPACTNSGVAALVMRTGTAVVPTFIVRKEGNRHVMEFQPEIPMVLTGDRIKDIEINTQNYISAIEGIIRRYPEQWFWVHNRWKTKHYCLLSDQKRSSLKDPV